MDSFREAIVKWSLLFYFIIILFSSLPQNYSILQLHISIRITVRGLIIMVNVLDRSQNNASVFFCANQSKLGCTDTPMIALKLNCFKVDTFVQ